MRPKRKNGEVLYSTNIIKICRSQAQILEQKQKDDS